MSKQRSQDRPAGKTRRVFIVEDHPEMLKNLAFFVDRMPDLEVCGAVESAEEALEEIPKARPDLVMIDVSLPGMNGIDLVAELQTRRPGLHTLVVSGHSEDLYARRALEAGAGGYIMKGDAFAIIRAARQVLQGQPYLSERMRLRL